MGMMPTLILLLAGLGLGGYCLWYERRPRELGDVGMFPSTILLMVSVLGVVLALAHLVTLVTGVQLRGRGMF
ncbi:MAG: hypothetical protein H6851_12270 [Geminicoccaceae bacterium]|nr:hypothetical protein [Geminicoccaceae bacterium]